MLRSDYCPLGMTWCVFANYTLIEEAVGLSETSVRIYEKFGFPIHANFETLNRIYLVQIIITSICRIYL
jgi:hypothetical protein